MRVECCKDVALRLLRALLRISNFVAPIGKIRPYKILLRMLSYEMVDADSFQLSHNTVAMSEVRACNLPDYTGKLRLEQSYM